MAIVVLVGGNGNGAISGSAEVDTGLSNGHKVEVSVVRFLQLPNAVTAIAWSNVTHHLAVSHNWGRNIDVFDTKGHLKSIITNEYASLSSSLAFLPSGDVLVAPSAEAGSDQTNAMISLWNVQTGSILKSISGPSSSGNWTKNRAHAFSLSADGRRLVAIAGGSQGNALVFVNMLHLDTTPVSSVRQLLPDRDALTCVDISTDGRFAAVGTAGSEVIVLNTNNFELSQIANPFPDPLPPLITAVKFNPAGTLLAAGADQPLVPGPAAHTQNARPLSYFVGLWQLPSGQLYATLPEIAAPIRQMAWSPSGHFLAIAGGGDAVDVWNFTGVRPRQAVALPLEESAVAVTWLDDHVLAIASGSKVEVYQLVEKGH